MRLDALAFGLVVVGIVASSCAPAAPSASVPGAPEAPRAPKILTLGTAAELGSFGDFAGGGGSGGGCRECRAFAHDRLAVTSPDGVVEGRLAAELPSLEGGTWRVNPDGSMDVMWKIRPNVKWHDGTPFTSQDMLFTFTLYKDPELPTLYAGQLQMMASATAPDPLTFIVHWSQTFVRAHRQPELEPMPRHILEETYLQGDKAALISSPKLTTEFIGLGPYRLVRWEPGSFMEYERFDQYYLGRPPLDRVILQFVRDPNTLVANILAGALDAGSHNTIDLAAGLEIRQRWEGTGNRVDLEPTLMTMMVQTQQRPEYMRLKNAFSNRTVRQAMYHAIDKVTLNEVMTAGLAPLADSWLPPDHALRREVEGSIPQYPFDPGRAQQLLAQAGWTRGSDGVLVHSPSGERFDVEVWSKGRYSEKPITVIADGWKAVGAQPTLHVIPAARDSDREYEVTYPGAIFTNPPSEQFYDDYRLHSAHIAAGENRWTGRNQPGYVNSRFDAIIDRLQATIDPREQIGLHRQLLQEAMSDVAVMPLYWEQRPHLVLQGVTRGRSENVMLWNKS